MTETVPVVLVVDIDPDTHAISESAMHEGECVIVSARSAEIALKMAERRPPTVLVIGDRMAGLAYLSERLRRLRPHLHVVLLATHDPPHEATPFTAADPTVARAPARAPGVGSVIRKPLDPARFRTTLRTALRLSAMAEGVKRMHGDTTSESGPMPRVTPVPRVGSARDSNPGRENK